MLVAALREEPLLLRTIELCKFSMPDGDGVVRATVTSELKMHQDRMQSPQVQQRLRGVLSQAFGRMINLVVQVVAAGDGSTSLASGPPPGAAAKRVLDKLGGRIVGVNPEERRPAAPPKDDAPEDAPPAPDDTDS